MSVSTEDFIKGIYQLQTDHRCPASSSNMASRLGISHAAVTDMARKLSGQGLIHYRKYKAMELTEEGERIALQVIRRHRLWELFLSKVLQLPITQVHQEAEMLEHQTSDLLTEKINEYLGKPSVDPHGDPIPDASGKMPVVSKLLLAEGTPGKLYKISRVQDEAGAIADFCSRHDLYPGQILLLVTGFNNEPALTIRINRTDYQLERPIAEKICIQEIL